MSKPKAKAKAYSPGLKVLELTEHRKKRLLPLRGDVLVKVGQKVKAEAIVARTELPGKVDIINVVNRLGISPGELKESMKVKEGDVVKANQMIAESKGFFGFFKTPCNVSVDGSIESISDVTGQVVLRLPSIPVEINAYFDGTIDELIPHEGVYVKSYVSFIQGIFGVGGEVTAPLKVISNQIGEALTEDNIDASMKDHIIVGTQLVTYDGVKKAIEVGVKGIICAGINDHDLKILLGKDLGVAITGNERIGISIVVTEGFGEINMAAKTFELLKKREGAKTSINGATQIRAGVIRPEIIIPYENQEQAETKLKNTKKVESSLDAGQFVRIIRQPYFGEIAKVKSLPVDPVKMESETKVRVIEVELPNGKTHLMPRANVEMIEQ